MACGGIRLAIASEHMQPGLVHNVVPEALAAVDDAHLVNQLLVHRGKRRLGDFQVNVL